MNRRDLLRAGAALGLAHTIQPAFAWQDPAAPNQDPNEQPAPKPVIVAVNGSFDATRLGPTLCHEHILVDFIGAEQATPDRYNPEDVIRVALPHLTRIRDLGCTCLFECTPAFLGRNPALWASLSEASGLEIVTNTGLYAANGGKHLPAYVADESAEQLAARWIKEWNEGIDNTGIRPGFIKIGVDAGPLSETAKKLVRAAALTHKQTGLTIASHTGDEKAAVEQIGLIVAEGISPSAFVWVHAQHGASMDVHRSAVDLGAWVEFDGISSRHTDYYVQQIVRYRNANLLDRLLVSQDAGWYHVGEPDGGTYRGYDAFYTEFLPALKVAGLAEHEIRKLSVDNPREAFGVRIRLADRTPL